MTEPKLSFKKYYSMKEELFHAIRSKNCIWRIYIV